MMGLFGNYILEKEEEVKVEKLPPLAQATEEPVEKPTDKADDKDAESDGDESLVPAKTELLEIINDLTEEELELLLAHAYALVLTPAGKDDSEDDDEDDDDDNDDDKDKDEEVTEASIKHLTAAERSAGKMQRRTPKWKRKAKIRYVKNKKCPAGTTYSSVSKSCTRLNIDLSRLQKMIAKMRIKG